MCFFGELMNTITLSLLTYLDISVDWFSNEPDRTKVLQILLVILLRIGSQFSF